MNSSTVTCGTELNKYPIDNILDIHAHELIDIKLAKQF